jgi:hypothetical protein
VLLGAGGHFPLAYFGKKNRNLKKEEKYKKLKVFNIFFYPQYSCAIRKNIIKLLKSKSECRWSR